MKMLEEERERKHKCLSVHPLNKTAAETQVKSAFSLLITGTVVVAFVVVTTALLPKSASAEIIGSSVVTSVSVVLGNEGRNENVEEASRVTTAEPLTTQEVPPTTNTRPDSTSAASATPSSNPASLPSSSSSPSPSSLLPVTPGAKVKAAEDVSTPSSSSITSTIPSTTTSPPSKSPGSISSVIATLKSIVETESLKHNKQSQSSSSSIRENNKSKSDLNTEEDYDDEDEQYNNRRGSTTTTRPSSTTRATTTAKSSPKPGTNQTATSAEVHEAIHRISGELLTPGKPAKKPIENILTDVLTSINDARNGSSSPGKSKNGNVKNSSSNNSKTSSLTVKHTPTSPPKKSPPPQQQQSTKRNPPTQPSAAGTRKPVASTKSPAPTTPVPSKTKTNVKVVTAIPQVTKATTPEPQIGTGVTKIAGIPTDGDDDNLTLEKDTEETEFLNSGIGMIGAGKDDFGSFLKKPAIQQQQQKKPTIKPHKGNGNNNVPQVVYLANPGNGKRKNATVSVNRPTEFYDDEIFGYDPYQTFLHGVYVPVVEFGGATEPIRDGEYDAGTTTICLPAEYQLKTKQRPFAAVPSFGSATTRSPNNPFISNTEASKPVPSLPDYLHRPRPEHLQYQHAVAENVDAETGLVRIKVQATNGAPPTVPTATAASLPPLVNKIISQSSQQEQASKPVNLAMAIHNLTASHLGAPPPENQPQYDDLYYEQTHGPIEKRPTFPKAPVGNPGLETSVTNLDTEMRSFVDLNNRLALRLLSSVTNPVSKASSSYGNMVVSPFTITSSLGMLFLGARGGTAAQIDGLLNLDDMLTFNPHLLYYNITQSFLSQSNTAAAIIRLLITDKSKGDVLEFFKTRVQHFYDARVEEADYKFAGHLAQSIINQMIRAQIQRHSYEMLNYSLPLRGPMSLLTAAFFDGQFSGIRDSTVQDMNFVHLASVGRRLIQVPALALTGPHKAVYDSELDATAVEIPYSTRDLSLILITPGRPGEFGIGGVNSLKSRLTLETWTALTRGFYQRSPFKVIFPRFRHQSTLNISYTLQRFGLTDMFTPHLAQFKGVNGLSDLYFDQNAMHFSEFATLEKLSDTMNEGSFTNGGNSGLPLSPVGSGKKKLDLVRILRPHVREHYGNYEEPMSVGDWIFQQSSLAGLAQAQAAAAKASATAYSLHDSIPRFNSPPIPYSMMSSQYHPFLSYARVRSAKQAEGGNKINLSRLFTRDSKTKKKSTHKQAQHLSQMEADSSEDQVLRFERPFIYVLRHAPTGMILMCGQYTDPTMSNSD